MSHLSGECLRATRTTPAGRSPSLRTYAARKNGVPPEILGLGEAESIHRPSLESLTGTNDPRVLAVVGVVMSVGCGIALAALRPSGILFPILGLGVLAGLAVAAAPWLLKMAKKPTFLVYPDALVVVREDEFTVVPWDAVTQLNPGRNLVTSDGQTIHLDGQAADLQRLYDSAHNAVMSRLMPKAMAAIQAGESLTFGPVTVSAMEIGYKNNSTPWIQVTGLTIVGPNPRQLQIRVHGRLLSWCPDLNSIPNDIVLLEVIRQVCPRHLLTNVGG